MHTDVPLDPLTSVSCSGLHPIAHSARSSRRQGYEVESAWTRVCTSDSPAETLIAEGEPEVDHVTRGLQVHCHRLNTQFLCSCSNIDGH